MLVIALTVGLIIGAGAMVLEVYCPVPVWVCWAGTGAVTVCLLSMERGDLLLAFSMGFILGALAMIAIARAIKWLGTRILERHKAA